MAEPITANHQDLEEIISLSDQMFLNKPGQVSMGKSFGHLLSADNLGNILIVREDGRVVSMMAWYPAALNINGCTVRAASLGSVCTDPVYREKQYATRMMEMAIRRLHQERVCLLLIYGNRGLYTRHHAMSVGQVQRFQLHASVLPYSFETEKVEVRNMREEDIPSMIRVMQGEAVFFERDPDEFLKLIRLETLLSTYPAKQRIFMRKKSGRIDGYLVFGTWSENGAVRGEAIEFAGHDEAVIQLLREAIHRHKIAELTVTVPNFRSGLADRLVASDCQFETERIPGTFLIPHFLALWESLRPYFAAQLGKENADNLTCEQTEEGCRIHFGGETLTADMRMAVSLVFNGPQLVGSGLMKETLSRIFPLPFLSPNNLNFV